MSFVWRKRWFLILFPLLLAASIWRIDVETDLNAFFTATDNEDSRLLSAMLKSGELSRRYLLVVERIEADAKKLPDSDAEQSLDIFSAKLNATLAGIDDVEKVWLAHQPPREWLDAITGYAPFHARIFSLEPSRDAGELFDPGGLAGRAEGLRDALLAPQGGFLKAIAKQDPLLLSLNGFREMENSFRRQAELGSGGALILQSRPAALDSAAHAKLQAAIRAGFDGLNRRAGGGFKLSMAGVPVFSVSAHAEISQDVTLVSVASSAAVILAFLLLFRSFSALHWVMMVQAAAFVVGTLATALIFTQVHSLTLALGASLIGICTDYPIHVMVHCAKHRHTPLGAVRLLWPSLAMGGLTTVIGYAALGMTGFPGFEQIAVFAFFSIAASLALTRWVLPALLAKSNLHAAHLPGISGWVDFCGSHRKVLIALFSVGVVLAAVSLPRLRWMDDMQKLALDMDQLKQEDSLVRAHFTSIEPGRFILIQAGDMEMALQRAEAVERRLRVLRQQGVLGEYHGFFPGWFPKSCKVKMRKFMQTL